MKTRKSYRISPRSIEALEKLKSAYPTWSETDLIEAAIESLYVTEQRVKGVYPETPLEHAALSAAQNYHTAACYKTPQVTYYEGKAKGLLNYADDIHENDAALIIKARRLVEEADEIMNANAQK